MQMDPDNNYIKAILTHATLTDALVLEIGCGAGRMTRDLAGHAGRIIAVDPDLKALESARRSVASVNVEFLHSPDGLADFPGGTFDLAIYTLSLHHIPAGKMLPHLQHTAELVKHQGRIIVIEPGEHGSFLEIKKRFRAGSGDEGPEKQAAIRAMQILPGWSMSKTHHFEVAFQFADENDFFQSKLPEYQTLPAGEVAEIRRFLAMHRTARGILLHSERHLNVLTRSGSG